MVEEEKGVTLHGSPPRKGQGWVKKDKEQKNKEQKNEEQLNKEQTNEEY